MPYLLLFIAAIVLLFGVAKIRLITQPHHGTPWGVLLLWSVLLTAGLSAWLVAIRFH